MNVYITVISLLLSLQLTAQFSLQPMATSNQRASTTEHTLTLPFWDDFSQSGEVPDSLLWLYGDDVYVNATLAQNAPSYKTATFDGLNGIGNAYNKTNDDSGAGDSLVSQPIDLSMVTSLKQPTVYLSFYWQARGFGELPDENDSLVLFFKSVADNPGDEFDWDMVFSQKGGESHENFEQVLLPLDSSDYFHDSFQFKFVSYSSQQGPFDTWHIDYIYLNENRNANDYHERDQALTGSPSLLFAPYYELPAQVFYENPAAYFTNQNVLLSNISDGGPTSESTNVKFEYRLRNLTVGIDYGTFSSSEFPQLAPLDIVQINNPGFESMVIESIQNPDDSMVLESTFAYAHSDEEGIQVLYETDGMDTILTNINKLFNDTIKTRYTLHNRYAYDDGSAEFTLALNGDGGKVAIKYGLGQPDVLSHVDIFIPSIAPDNVGKTISIMVWNDLTEDGLLARKTLTVSEPSGVNEFTRVQLSSPIAVSDTIFIGYEENTANELAIGFDRSNPAAGSYIYTNIKNFWEQNTEHQGALMIRPVFAYDTAFQLSANRDLPNLYAYPNPSSGVIKINEPYDYISVYNLAGELVYRNQSKDQHQLPMTQEGIYLLKIVQNDHITTQRIRISHE